MAVAGSLDESGLFSNSTNVSSSTSANPTYTGWTQFCERHARASASDFAKSCIHYVNKNLPENVRATVSHRDFMMKFIECFSDHFDTEFSRRRVHNKTGNGSVTLPEETYYTDEIEIPKTAHKPFFRRLSFKGLRRGKALFHKQHSDELELSGSRQNKVKLSNIVVECRKEGSVQYLTPESLEHPSGPHKWEKCRLALVKTVSGYMLEFYSPPKSQQPRSGLFCFLILEARETTALEMPDHENTFVLKTDNNKDYVIEARDTDDMRSWLATIRYCMRGTPTSQIPPSEPDMSITTVLHENNVTSLVPEIPPRRHADRVSTSSNFELTEGDLEQVETDTDLTAEMRQYPWFHGTLPRSDAAGLVLHGGLSGHGVFLVRQSETRKGEFVLTFNFQGKAKHLRMTLNDLGQCRVQHLWFPTISEMLEYFGEHPIPLESGGTADVKLTEYVINAAVTKSLQALANNSQAGSNNSQAVANNSQAVADNSQAVADNSQAVANNSQAVSNNSQAVSNNSQAESNNSQAVSNNSQAVSNNLQGVSNNLQGVLNNLQASTHVR